MPPGGYVVNHKLGQRTIGAIWRIFIEINHGCETSEERGGAWHLLVIQSIFLANRAALKLVRQKLYIPITIKTTTSWTSTSVSCYPRCSRRCPGNTSVILMLWLSQHRPIQLLPQMFAWPRSQQTNSRIILLDCVTLHVLRMTNHSRGYYVLLCKLHAICFKRRGAFQVRQSDYIWNRVSSQEGLSLYNTQPSAHICT